MSSLLLRKDLSVNPNPKSAPNPISKPKAYSYIRFSSAKQAKGDSLRRQLEATQAFAQEHDLELDEELTLKDLGLSAYKGEHLGENGALGQFIRAVKEGLVPSGSYLIVESLDRLSRQKVTAALSMFLAILEKGIVLVTLADRQIYSSASIDENYTQLIISLSIMARSHEESKIKANRVHQAYNNKKQLARDGVKKLSKNGPTWCDWNDETKDFELNPEKAAVLRRLFDLAIRDYGVWDITKIMNDEGVPRLGTTRKHNSWEHANVHHMLTNRICIGEYQPTSTVTGKRINDGEPILDYYPKVIDDDIFRRVQLKLSSRKMGGSGAGRKGTNFTNLFRGISECGYCGSTFTVARYKNNYIAKKKDPSTQKKGLGYFKCNGNYRRACCDAPNVNYEPIEDQIMKTMVELDFDLIFDTQSSDNERTKIIQDLEIKRSDLSETKAKIQRGSERLFESDDLPDAFYQKLKELENSSLVLQSEIEILESVLSTFEGHQRMNSEINIKLRDALDSIAKCSDLAELKDIRQNVNSQLKSLLTGIKIWPGGQVASDNYFENIERRALENGTFKENMFPEAMREAARSMMGSEYDKHKAQVTLTFKSGKSRTIWIDLKKNTSKLVQIDPNKKISNDDPRIQAIRERQLELKSKSKS